MEVLLRTGHEGLEGEQMYSYILPSTSAIDEGGWSTPRPAALPPGKTRYPLYRRLGRPRGRSGRVRKIWPTPGFDPQTVQPVASRYTDWAIPAHTRWMLVVKFTPRLLHPTKINPGTQWIGGWMGPGAGMDLREQKENPWTLARLQPRMVQTVV